MKKLFIPFLMLISVNLFAQPWKSVQGDGTIKKETRQLTDFNSIFSHGPLDVKISYGNSNSIDVEADENLLQYIETTVENGKLVIKPKSNMNLKSESKMTVYVSMTKIKSLQLSGSGNITGDGKFESDGKTTLMLSGSGNIKLSSGSFNDLSLFVSGSGNIDVNGGSADQITASISGSGNIDCSSVATENADAKISGSGNVKVNASKSINANISGSGNVFYKGDATNITTKTIGSGKAIKMNS
jgi:hypothetical protein